MQINNTPPLALQYSPPVMAFRVSVLVWRKRLP